MTNYAWRPPAVNGGWENVLASFGIVPGDVEPFGPMGLQCRLTIVGGKTTRGSLIITQAEQDGQEWLHVSMAFADRDPTYAEIQALHRSTFGRKRFAYQVFAPDSEHVNIHEHALHLWGHVNGARLTPAAIEGSI